MYENSASFERRVLGRCSSSDLYSQITNKGGNFVTRMEAFIEEIQKSGVIYPDTMIGKSLYFLTKKELEKRNVSTKGFIFAPTTDTNIDLLDRVDCVFILPARPICPVMIDLFNLHIPNYLYLKGVWEDSYVSGYTETEMQDELFRYKSGARERWWVQGKGYLTEGMNMFRPEDLRVHSSCKRPLNRFILTPYHVSAPLQRKWFAQMVATYLTGAGGQKMAEQSP